MAFLFAVAAPSAALHADGATPLKAGVIVLQRHAVPLTVTLSGQSVAEENANIRPLVDGIVANSTPNTTPASRPTSFATAPTSAPPNRT